MLTPAEFGTFHHAYMAVLRHIINDREYRTAGRGKDAWESTNISFRLTGDMRNCQCMVMLTYASVHGHAFIDRELYLPQSWTDDPHCCADAGVPTERGFLTKPHLGVTMLARALADPALRFGWLVTDSGYGRDPRPTRLLPRPADPVRDGRAGRPAPRRGTRRSAAPR